MCVHHVECKAELLVHIVVHLGWILGEVFGVLLGLPLRQLQWPQPFYNVEVRLLTRVYCISLRKVHNLWYMYKPLK